MTDSSPEPEMASKMTIPAKRPLIDDTDALYPVHLFHNATKTSARPLQHKIAIVTDSDRKDGVSRIAAVTLGHLGACVAVTCTSNHGEGVARKTAALVRQVGSLAFVVRSSPFNLVEAQALVERVMLHFGVRHIDILAQVNNTGRDIRLYRPMTLAAIPKLLLQDFEGNLLSAVYMTQAVMEYLAVGGRVIYLESYAGSIPMPSPCRLHAGSTTDGMQVLANNSLAKIRNCGATVNTIAFPHTPSKDTPSPEDSKQMWLNAFDDMNRRMRCESRLDEISQVIARLCKDSGKGITNKVIRVGFRQVTPPPEWLYQVETKQRRPHYGGSSF